MSELIKAVGSLLSNVDSSRVPDTTTDWITQHPAEAGAQFTSWLANGCRTMIGEPKIISLAGIGPFNPTEFVGKGWTVWKGPADGDGLEGEEDCDRRSLTLPSFDLSSAILYTGFTDQETSLVGEEQLARQKASGQIRLGGNVFLALWQDHQTNRENSCLEWLRRNRKVTYVKLTGLVLRSPDGIRYVLCFYFRGDRCYWDGRWLGRGFSAGYPSFGVASN